MGWHKDANGRAKVLEATFKNCLRQVAEAFASHDRHPTVSASHVDKAFEALANAGLCNRRWIDRPESEAAAGAFLIGLAFSFPDAVALMVDGENSKRIATALMFASLVIGSVFSAHAWYRGRLPSVPREDGKLWPIFRRTATWVALAAIAVITGYMIFERFSAFCYPTPSVPAPHPTTVDDPQSRLMPADQ